VTSVDRENVCIIIALCRHRDLWVLLEEIQFELSKQGLVLVGLVVLVCCVYLGCCRFVSQCCNKYLMKVFKSLVNTCSECQFTAKYSDALSCQLLILFLESFFIEPNCEVQLMTYEPMLLSGCASCWRAKRRSTAQ